jgi:hypothetical protein
VIHDAQFMQKPFKLSTATSSGADRMLPSHLSNMAATFTLFARLPYKLRNKIWHHALPLFPRIIELRNVRSKDELHKNALARWIAFPTLKPTLLSVNRESRQTLLPYYAAPFQALRICPRLGIESLLINYEIDTLFINIGFRWPTFLDVLFRHLFGSTFAEVQDNLKRVAGTEHFWAPLLEEAWQRRMRGNMTEFMIEFSSLEETIAVAVKEFPERPFPWRLIWFVDLSEESEEWRRLEEDLYPFFNPYRKKRYSERLCVATGRPSDSWKLRLR